MLTQIVTFLIFVAIIGCILYGRRLIRTEKVDAVFGNPERALGGKCWVWLFCYRAWLCDHGWTSFQDTQIGSKRSREESCGKAMPMPQL